MPRGKRGNLSYWLEYVLLRGAGSMIRLLPRRWALAFGRAAGSLFFRISSRREVALDNLRLAYAGELPPRELQRIAREAFRNIAQLAVESLWTRGRLTPARFTPDAATRRPAFTRATP